MNADVSPDAVLHFWFGPPSGAALQPRSEWFRKSDDFDALIRTRFGALIEDALAGRLPAPWHAGTLPQLAQLLVLDQFTRNVFRGSARAFEGDDRALSLAQALVAEGADRTLDPVQRWFVYLPFEHAEDPALQERSVQLFAELAGGNAAFASALDYAHRHREVIQRFGRFPHRNAALQRTSTADELAWLQQPGSGF